MRDLSLFERFLLYYGGGYFFASLFLVGIGIVFAAFLALLNLRISMKRQKSEWKIGEKENLKNWIMIGAILVGLSMFIEFYSFAVGDYSFDFSIIVVCLLLLAIILRMKKKKKIANGILILAVIVVVAESG